MDQAFPPTARTASITALAAHIAAHVTATEALRHWCTRRLDRPDTAVTAQVLSDVEAARPRSLAPSEPWRYRRVRLMSGGTVLSEAENWYLPGRLPQAMRDALRTGDVPFGALVASLQPRRILVACAVTGHGGHGVPPPRTALHLRAVVTTADHGVIAEVHEHYRHSLIAPPHAGHPHEEPWSQTER